MEPAGLQRGLEDVLVLLEGVHQAIPDAPPPNTRRSTSPAAAPRPRRRRPAAAATVATARRRSRRTLPRPRPFTAAAAAGGRTPTARSGRSTAPRGEAAVRLPASVGSRLPRRRRRRARTRPRPQAPAARRPAGQSPAPSPARRKSAPRDVDSPAGPAAARAAARPTRPARAGPRSPAPRQAGRRAAPGRAARFAPLPRNELFERPPPAEHPAREPHLAFRAWVLVLVPLAAILFQVYVPLFFQFLGFLELPLLVTVYFALMRRSQITGLSVGAVGRDWCRTRCPRTRWACSAS